LAGAPVLVTGGAGFIGSHLVDALLDLDAEVRVLDDLSTGLASNLAHCRDRIEFIEGDLRSTSDVARACQARRYVFHQAALGSVPRSMKDPGTTIAVNVAGTANLFVGARDAGAQRVVYASSSSVYGDSPRLPKIEGQEGSPLSPYALSKCMNEELADTFARCFDMELVGLRYFNVYGPRQRPDGPYAAVIPRFFAAALEARSPIVHGDGEQSRDFTFVTDAVAANLAAAVSERIDGSATINVAGGRRTTVNQLAEAILTLADSKARPEHQADRPGDVKHSLADLSLAASLTHWKPTTELEQGLAASLAHYESLLETA